MQDIILKFRNDYSPMILRFVFGGKMAYHDISYCKILGFY